MMFESSLPSRDELRDVLLRWQRGEITFYRAVEEAEAAEERLPDYVIEDPLPVAEPWCVAFITLDLLASGFSEPLFVEDIPHLLAYLETQHGKEIEATERLFSELGELSSTDRLRKPEQLYSWERDTAV